jgi:hypothetical protein
MKRLTGYEPVECVYELEAIVPDKRLSIYGSQCWDWGRRVGVVLPEVEVRFKELSVEATAYSSGRALPSIYNSVRNVAEVCNLWSQPT